MSTNNIINIDGYKLLKKIGSGSYSEVFKAKCLKSSKLVAIKCVKISNLSKSANNNLITEIGLLKKLKHKHIVEMYDFKWDNENVYLIMEYCSGGDLSTYIKSNYRLNESACQFFLQQLSLALKYLRENNVGHFDLKPQNVLIYSKENKYLKLADFGLAQHITETDTISIIKGSPLYMAPEILRSKKYDLKADIWSVGVILFECLFGKAPYSTSSIDELILKIKDDSVVKIPTGAKISKDCNDFLSRCLQKSVEDRIDYENFFSHPFIGLKYAPSDTSLSEAASVLSIAVQADKNGKVDVAYEHYNHAIKYLVPAMYFEIDYNKRIDIKHKILQYIKRMEEIKGSNQSSTLKSEINFEKICGKQYSLSDDFKELLSLSKHTPSIETAIEIAQSAELYSQEGKYDVALEKYELSLGKLLTLLSSEPNGRRRKLLLEEVNRWMVSAEKAKNCCKQETKNTVDLYVMQEAEAVRTCGIQ